MTAPAAKLCLMCGSPIKARVRRLCFDCKKPIGRTDKWRWVERYGIATCVHRQCEGQAA